MKPGDLVMTRVFDAPVTLAWLAWSDSAYVRQWWGPTGFTAPVADMDFRESGTSLVCMSGHGMELYNTWTYTRIVPHERIAFVLHWADKDGKRIDPSAIGMPPDMPREVPHLITFKNAGAGRTEMTITESGYVSDAQLEMSRAGLAQCLDKMAAMFAAAQAG